MKYSHHLPPFRRAVQKWHKARAPSNSGCSLNILFAMSSDRLLASQSYPGYGKIISYYNVTTIHDYVRSVPRRVAQRLLLILVI